MFEFARRVRFGVDVGQFFQFERAFGGDGVVFAAPEVEAAVAVLQRFGRLGDLGFEGEDVLQQARQVVEGLQLFAREGAALFAGDDGVDEVQDGELGHKGLGRGDADFAPGAGEDGMVRGAGQRAFGDVADGEVVVVAPVRFGFFEGG